MTRRVLQQMMTPLAAQPNNQLHGTAYRRHLSRAPAAAHAAIGCLSALVWSGDVITTRSSADTSLTHLWTVAAGLIGRRCALSRYERHRLIGFRSQGLCCCRYWMSRSGSLLYGFIARRMFACAALR